MKNKLAKNERQRKLAALCCAAALLLTGCAGAAASSAAETAASSEVAASETASPEPAVSSEAAESETAGEPFAYEHDPRENPVAMSDIVENPNAVYGFSPDPESTRLGEYASYDWTDAELVAQAKEARMEYEASFESMADMLSDMLTAGYDVETIARAVSEERNRLRLASYDNDPEGLAEVKKSNLETYGNENGPTPEWLYDKYGSWEVVLQKAFSPNMGMDVCCGLYDDNYELYVELGLIEE